MAQSRRPAGIPTGGQFSPTNRPDATGIELSEDSQPGLSAPIVSLPANVDWALLRKQKLRLVELADPHSELGGDADLAGIVGLLDAIQDQAAEVLGEQAVFGEDEDPDGDDLDDADDET